MSNKSQTKIKLIPSKAGSKPKDSTKSPKRVIKELKLIEEKAVIEYFSNPTSKINAAVRAGIPRKKASYEMKRILALSAAKKLLKNLKNDFISESIERKELIVREMYLLAMSDIGDCYDKDGNILNILDIPPEIRRCIKQVKNYTKVMPNGIKQPFHEIKLHDKAEALKLIGTHYDLFVQSVRSETTHYIGSMDSLHDSMSMDPRKKKQEDEPTTTVPE